MNGELCLFRTISIATGSRNHSFMQAVRERDEQCVVTGFKSKSWRALEAAHVFPLGHAAHWEKNNFGRWVTDDADRSMNSVQN